MQPAAAQVARNPIHDVGMVVQLLVNISRQNPMEQLLVITSVLLGGVQFVQFEVLNRRLSAAGGFDQAGDDGFSVGQDIGLNRSR
jgi:hypothetical protein